MSLRWAIPLSLRSAIPLSLRSAIPIRHKSCIRTPIYYLLDNMLDLTVKPTGNKIIGNYIMCDWSVRVAHGGWWLWGYCYTGSWRPNITIRFLNTGNTLYEIVLHVVRSDLISFMYYMLITLVNIKMLFQLSHKPEVDNELLIASNRSRSIIGCIYYIHWIFRIGCHLTSCPLIVLYFYVLMRRTRIFASELEIQ